MFLPAKSQDYQIFSVMMMCEYVVHSEQTPGAISLLCTVDNIKHNCVVAVDFISRIKLADDE